MLPIRIESIRCNPVYPVRSENKNNAIEKTKKEIRSKGLVEKKSTRVKLREYILVKEGKCKRKE